MKPLKTKVSITLDENVIDTIKKWQKKMIGISVSIST